MLQTHARLSALLRFGVSFSFGTLSEIRLNFDEVTFAASTDLGRTHNLFKLLTVLIYTNRTR